MTVDAYRQPGRVLRDVEVTRYSPALHEELCEALRAGTSLDQALTVANVSPFAFQRWTEWAQAGREPYAAWRRELLAAARVGTTTKYARRSTVAGGIEEASVRWLYDCEAARLAVNRWAELGPVTLSADSRYYGIVRIVRWRVEANGFGFGGQVEFDEDLILYSGKHVRELQHVREQLWADCLGARCLVNEAWARQRQQTTSDER